MSKTGFTTSSNETKKLWDEALFRDAYKDAYFTRFMGGSDSIVHEKTQLEKDRGDRIRFGLVDRVDGNGVSEGQTLEGNEDSLSSSTFDLTLTQWRYGIRDDGAMSRQRAMFSITDETRNAIKGRLSEKVDKLCFDAVTASPTKIMYRDGGVNMITSTEATAIAGIEATDKIDVSMISFVKAWAKTGGNRAQVPLRGVKINGKEHYILLISPDQEYDLKQDTDWIAAQQYANIRGNDNPLFTGAIGMWDNVIVHVHENVPLTTTWGGSGAVKGAKAVFMGAQSLVWAWGQRPQTNMQKFDYDNEVAYSVSMIYGVGKPTFNSVDYGSIAFYTARTAISDS